jgi:hypothetical protein
MAGFRMHVGTSSALGCGYAGVLHTMYGVPAPTATLAGALCGAAGMLPDLDSDYGVPLREAMSFAAAAIPVFLVNQFESLQLSRNAIILLAVGLYLFVRFGIGTMIRKFTVHRGMFHSIPAMLICGGITFILTGMSPINERFMMAGGVMGGFLSHLILDEIYAIEYKGGRWRAKKSFGTALKFWGGDGWSNFSAYAKLAIVGMGVVGEPNVVKQFTANQPQLAKEVKDAINALANTDKSQPQFAKQVDQLRDLLGALNGNANPNGGFPPQNGGAWPTPPNAPQPNGGWPAYNPQQPTNQYAGPSVQPFNQNQYQPSSTPAQQPQQPAQASNQPSDWQWPVANQSYINNGQPATFQNEFNTAQRPSSQYSQ